MTEKTYSAKALALEIGCDPKSLRGWLRSNHARQLEAKNTSWIIPESIAQEARDHFAKQRAGSAAPTNESE